MLEEQLETGRPHGILFGESNPTKKFSFMAPTILLQETLFGAHPELLLFLHTEDVSIPA